jgi:hypothetical protein
LYDSVEEKEKEKESEGSFSYKDFFRYPVLDFKLLNNTNKTVVIDYVKIDVKKSKLFKSAYLRYGEYQVETYCSDEGLTFSNIGSLKAKNVTINFNISDVTKNIFSTRDKIHYDFNNLKYKRKFSIDPMSIEKINIDEELKKEGINLSKLSLEERSNYEAYIKFCINEYDTYFCSDKKMKKSYQKVIEKSIIGRFGNKKSLKSGNYKEPFVYGYVEYNYFNPFEDRYIKIKNEFRAQINIFPFSECGGSLEISEEYDYKLNNKGANYIIDANDISHVIKSEDADRFTLKLGVDKASFHVFDVKIHTIEYGYLPSQRIKLFIPKY